MIKIEKTTFKNIDQSSRYLRWHGTSVTHCIMPMFSSLKYSRTHELKFNTLTLSIIFEVRRTLTSHNYHSFSEDTVYSILIHMIEIQRLGLKKLLNGQHVIIPNKYFITLLFQILNEANCQFNRHVFFIMYLTPFWRKNTSPIVLSSIFIDNKLQFIGTFEGIFPYL